MARPKGAVRRWSVIKRAVSRYIDDEPVGIIAKDTGVKPSTISHWMRRYGTRVGGDRFKLRSQGRRTAEVPNERDQEICDLRALGVPVSILGIEFNLKRQRIDYIVKTWERRGYQPVPKFRVDDLVYVEPSDSVYKILSVSPDGKKAQVQLVCERNNGQWTDVEETEICDLPFFYKGRLVKLLDHDRLPGQTADIEAAPAAA